MTQLTPSDNDNTATNAQYIPRTFEGKILYFNKMYNLPISPGPGFAFVGSSERVKNPELTDRTAILQRLDNFVKILQDELAESEDIKIAIGQREAPIDILTMMADWYGDIIIYCASEMVKYGLPIMDILNIIMSSNFSKLDKDGRPIYDTTGKVLKGPNYYKPEPAIKTLLEECLAIQSIERD